MQAERVGGAAHVAVGLLDGLADVLHLELGGCVGQRLIDTVHDAALGTGVASLDALRTRGEARDVYAVADRHPANGFVSVTARLGPGRTSADIERLLAAVLDAVEECLGETCRHLMLSAEVQEIDPERRINRNHLRAAVRARATNEGT